MSGYATLKEDIGRAKVGWKTMLVGNSDMVDLGAVTAAVR